MVRCSHGSAKTPRLRHRADRRGAKRQGGPLGRPQRPQQRPLRLTACHVSRGRDLPFPSGAGIAILSKNGYRFRAGATAPFTVTHRLAIFTSACQVIFATFFHPPIPLLPCSLFPATSSLRPLPGWFFNDIASSGTRPATHDYRATSRRLNFGFRDELRRVCQPPATAPSRTTARPR